MDTEGSLRESQEDVAANPNSAKSESASPSWLGVRVGSRFCLIVLSDISETMPIPELTPVPLSQPWFCGVASVRGNLHGIVDFAFFMGEIPTPFGEDCRLLLIHPKFSVNCGIVAGNLLGLRNTEKMQRVETEREALPWVAAEYLDESGLRWQELDMRILTRHPDFLNVGLAG